MSTLKQLLRSEKIRDTMQRLIGSEKKANPYTDQRLAEALTNAGYDISMDMVKYHRVRLNIPGAPIRQKNYEKIKSKNTKTRKNKNK